VLRLIVDLFGEDVVGSRLWSVASTGFEKNAEAKTVEGDHLPGADRLPLLPEQRARLRAGDEQLLASRRPEGLVDAHTCLCEPTDSPHLVWLGTASELGAISMFWYCFASASDPRSVRDGLRHAHAHALLPGRWAGRASRLLPRGAQVRRLDAPRGRRVRGAVNKNKIWLERTRSRLLSAGRDRARAVGPGAARIQRRLGPRNASPTSPMPSATSRAGLLRGDVYAATACMEEMRESTKIVGSASTGSKDGG
jgi:NADH:ubiquinone oxidoreductase subunit D